MLTVVVGVVFVAGMLFKNYIPTLFDQITQMVTGAAGNLGTGGP